MTKLYLITIRFGRNGCVRGKRRECLIQGYDYYTALDATKKLIKKYKINLKYYENDILFTTKVLDIITNEEQNLTTTILPEISHTNFV